MVRTRHFLFGKNVSPDWFLRKVKSKDVEYVVAGGRIVACKFEDTEGKERVIAIGEVITMDMLYTDEDGQIDPGFDGGLTQTFG